MPNATQKKYQKHDYARTSLFCNTHRKFEQKILKCTVREVNKLQATHKVLILIINWKY